MISSTKTRVAAIALAAFASTTMAAPAFANDDDVIREGPCSGASDWKLKASPENGRIEVEFEVDTNINGQNWQVRLSDNGTRIFQGTRTTVGPSGSFEVRVVTANRAGPDNILGNARNPQTGETCVGRVTFP